MAEVLTTKFDNTIQAPFTGRYCAVEYNGYAYIVTNTGSVYRFDATNKIFTLMVTATVEGDIYGNAYIVDDNMFIVRATSTTIYINKYNITNNLYTTGFSSFMAGTNHSFVNYGAHILYNNSIYVYRSWAQSSTMKSFIYIFNINDGATSVYNPKDENIPNSGQIINNLFFGSSRSNRQYGIIQNLTFGTVNYNGYNSFGAWKTIYGYSTYKKDNDLYIIGGYSHETAITKHNITTREFTDIDYTIPFSCIYKNCVQIGNTYYIFDSTGLLSFSYIDYDLTYKIANKTGEQEYTQLTGQSPITQVRFNYSGTGDVGYVFNTLSGTILGTYTPNIPSGYKLVGFGSAPNTKLALAGLNTDVPISINENFTFYEIYQVYKPPATTFEMNLYQNIAENNRVDKTDYLTSVGSLFGALRAECSILKPSIIIEQEELPAFNYVYIGAFNRYYFVTGITSVAYRMWRIELTTDVLMTYKDGIALLTAIIARQENDYNDNLIDAEIPLEKQQVITVEEIPNTVLSNQLSATAQSMVLTVIGR